MRLGSYPAVLREGSVAASAYGTTEVTERHRHRYEVNNAYRDRLEEAGLVVSGPRPTVDSWSSSNFRPTCTPTTWRPRPIPS